jgi:hypothetical protein
MWVAAASGHYRKHGSIMKSVNLIEQYCAPGCIQIEVLKALAVKKFLASN